MSDHQGTTWGDKIDMELLAPAGGMEQLRAALAFGADAVYLAADKFGMRARATNFSMDEIPEAVALAHEYGAKVHVTCNVLMHPDDMDELPAYFRALDEAGVDAFIIGDMGAFAVAGEVAPRVERHVSTQASVANAQAARVWHSLGAKRVVCAREMSLADIARMRQEIPEDLELEAFVHGAMCMAVSGRCLISSYLTGRSGNKGNCTQPCRWSYQIEEEKRPGQFFPVEETERGSFIMNAKDLNMLSHVRELARAGVNSIKIEGRNKKAFYVATVVGAYRRVLDGQNPALVEEELFAISHRPYDTGFYFHEGVQAPEYDGYEQETIHVADIVEVKSGDAEGEHFAYVVCRNRFSEGEALEVLSPAADPFELVVKDVRWYPYFGPDMHDQDAPKTVQDALERAQAQDWVCVADANRSKNVYRITTSVPLMPGSFLRVRTPRRSARHQELTSPAASQDDSAAADTSQASAASTASREGAS
ncbi:U32 family peptidase [Eggerthellaceae bacterium 3-80]